MWSGIHFSEFCSEYQMNWFRVVVIFIHGVVVAGGDGGQEEVVVGVNGKVYRVDTNVCSGGVVFKHPVNVTFVCVSGFFLQRRSACSDVDERVIGKADGVVCKSDARLQSLIQMTNPRSPKSHTVSFYDDKNLVKNLKRYTVKDKESYVQSTTRSEFAIVTNPQVTDPIKIGAICYSGEKNNVASAFRIKVNSSLVNGTACDKNSSSVVHPTHGIAYDDERETGVFNLTALEDEGYGDVQQNLVLKKRGLHPGDSVVIDFMNDKVSSTTTTSSTISSTTSSTISSTTSSTTPSTTPSTSASTPQLSDSPAVSETKPSESSTTTEQPVINPPVSVTTTETTTTTHSKHVLPDNVVSSSPTKKASAVVSSEEQRTDSSPHEVNTYAPSNGQTEDVDDDDNFVTESSSRVGDDDDAIPLEDSTKETIGADWPSSEERGRADDIEMLELSGETGNSGEEDEMGSWESLKRVLARNEFQDSPEPGTLEYDALTDGIEEFFDNPTSPHFEAYINILKWQISHILSGCQGNGSCSTNVLSSVQPTDSRWYAILAGAVEVAKAVTPDEVVQDQFYNDALLLFGYYGRIIQDTELLSLSEFSEIIDGLRSCAADAVNSSLHLGNGDEGAVFSTRVSDFDCDVVELEMSSYETQEWNEYTKSYSKATPVVLDYQSSDPNGYLPPRASRLNPRNWVFSELMWYSFQMAYAFCFDTFSGLAPNAYLKMQWYVIETLFRDKVILEPWSSRKTGNLQVFETMLNHIQHSAKVSGSSNNEDFERLLIELDKVSFVVHEVSKVNHWMTRPVGKTVNEQVAYGGSLVNGKGFRVRVAGDKFSGVKDWGKRDRTFVFDGGEDNGVGLKGRRRRRRAVQGKEDKTTTKLVTKSEENPTITTTDTPEIWDGLAYCVKMRENTNEQGQTVQYGLDPPLESFVRSGVC